MIELSNPKAEARVDSDMLGECVIDNASLYGIHTWRALGNFPISGVQLGSEVEYVTALATTKLAVAQANHALGLLSDRQFHALSAACREVMEGRHLDHFQVDVMEGSGGTSTNMNVNEVLANRALDLLGVARGDYTALHPNDHVNRSQSTSDVSKISPSSSKSKTSAYFWPGMSEKAATALTPRTPTAVSCTCCKVVGD